MQQRIKLTRKLKVPALAFGMMLLSPVRSAPLSLENVHGYAWAVASAVDDLCIDV